MTGSEELKSVVETYKKGLKEYGWTDKRFEGEKLFTVKNFYDYIYLRKIPDCIENSGIKKGLESIHKKFFKYTEKPLSKIKRAIIKFDKFKKKDTDKLIKKVDKLIGIAAGRELEFLCHVKAYLEVFG